MAWPDGALRPRKSVMGARQESRTGPGAAGIRNVAIGLSRSIPAGQRRYSVAAGHRPQADIALLYEPMQFLAYATP
jgi:hypothetical protein